MANDSALIEHSSCLHCCATTRALRHAKQSLTTDMTTCVHPFLALNPTLTDAEPIPAARTIRVDELPILCRVTPGNPCLTIRYPIICFDSMDGIRPSQQVSKVGCFLQRSCPGDRLVHFPVPRPHWSIYRCGEIFHILKRPNESSAPPRPAGGLDCNMARWPGSQRMVKP
jgi:hypothetical protein